MFTCSFKLCASCWISSSGEQEPFLFHFHLIFIAWHRTWHADPGMVNERMNEWMNRLGKSQLNCVLLHGCHSVQSNTLSFNLYDLPRTSSGVRWPNSSSCSGRGEIQVNKQLRYSAICCQYIYTRGAMGEKIVYSLSFLSWVKKMSDAEESGTGFPHRDREASWKSGEPEELNVAEAEAGAGMRGGIEKVDMWRLWRTLCHMLNKDFGLYLSGNGKPPQGFQKSKDVTIFIL